ncbi:MAG TPA: hypothetical protein VEI83_17160 [Acidimicrobiales bacterium]|nr:hypothetical protein [Acidimicrobiales bacterium]
MSGPRYWSVEHRRADPESLIGSWPADPGGCGRTAALCEPVGAPALVLGSTQAVEDVDRDALQRQGVVLLRRGSGGGAVLVAPGEQLWIEFWVPRADPLWDDDVVRAAHWAGEVWRRALTAVGVDGLDLHRGRAVRGPWSDSVCFAGRGPGEVVRRGAKLVGLAQRRTRHGARIATVALRRWQPETVLALLALPGGSGPATADPLAEGATGLEVLGAWDAGLAEAVLESLPV